MSKKNVLLVTLKYIFIIKKIDTGIDTILANIEVNVILSYLSSEQIFIKSLGLTYVKKIISKVKKIIAVVTYLLEQKK